jgi:hypothetical protein
LPVATDGSPQLWLPPVGCETCPALTDTDQGFIPGRVSENMSSLGNGRGLGRVGRLRRSSKRRWWSCACGETARRVRVTKDFDLTEIAVREWVKRAERDTGTRSDGLTSGEEELAQLQRENRRLREDVRS